MSKIPPTKTPLETKGQNNSTRKTLRALSSGFGAVLVALLVALGAYGAAAYLGYVRSPLDFLDQSRGIDGAANGKVFSQTDSQRHAQILSEVVAVVLEQKPAQFSSYRELLSSLDQGASIEGIYRGLTSTEHFRSTEKTQGPASPRTLALFGALMAMLVDRSETNAGITTVPDYDFTPGVLPKRLNLVQKAHDLIATTELARRPPIDRFRPRPGQDDHLTADLAPPPSPIVKPTPAQSRAEISDRFAKSFVGYSAATLRRVLGELALDVLDETPSLRAETYFQWIASICQLSARPSFGLALRDRCGPGDLDFQRRWAQSASSDAIAWEILNRLHRLILWAENGEMNKGD